MKLYTRLLAVLCLVCWLYSCSTPKDIAYFQNAADVNGMSLPQKQQFHLRPEDKINIIVNSADPMLMRQFNLMSASNSVQSLGTTVIPQTSSGNVSSSNGMTLAYTVDEQGDIFFPVLGKIAIGGLTRQEVADYIRQRLIARDLVKDPIVTVEYVNLSVSVLGEVNKPGRIDILKDHFTIMDAIAAAGDLTINGKRENVMVSRQIDGEDHTFFINLCDREDVLNSPAYYLQQDDIVYVTPNRKRLRESNSMGNTFNQPSIWISIASLLTTITALLIR